MKTSPSHRYHGHLALLLLVLLQLLSASASALLLPTAVIPAAGDSASPLSNNETDAAAAATSVAVLPKDSESTILGDVNNGRIFYHKEGGGAGNLNGPRLSIVAEIPGRRLTGVAVSRSGDRMFVNFPRWDRPESSNNDGKRVCGKTKRGGKHDKRECRKHVSRQQEHVVVDERQLQHQHPDENGNGNGNEEDDDDENENEHEEQQHDDHDDDDDDDNNNRRHNRFVSVVEVLDGGRVLLPYPNRRWNRFPARLLDAYYAIDSALSAAGNGRDAFYFGGAMEEPSSWRDNLEDDTFAQMRKFKHHDHNDNGDDNGDDDDQGESKGSIPSSSKEHDDEDNDDDDKEKYDVGDKAHSHDDWSKKNRKQTHGRGKHHRGKNHRGKHRSGRRDLWWREPSGAPSSSSSSSSSSASSLDTRRAAHLLRKIRSLARRRLVCVQSVVMDKENKLWILDPANPYFAGVIPDGPKLVQVDLATDRVVRVIHFDAATAPKNSYLNDVVFDLDRRFAFITDSGPGGGAIIVVNLATGQSQRRLAQSTSTMADPSLRPMIEGKPLRLPDGSVPQTNADGIALSPDGDTLYFQALTSRSLHSVPTAALRNLTLPERDLDAAVLTLGESVMTDGMTVDSRGRIYFTALEQDAIVRIDTRLRSLMPFVADHAVAEVGDGVSVVVDAAVGENGQEDKEEVDHEDRENEDEDDKSEGSNKPSGRKSGKRNVSTGGEEESPAGFIRFPVLPAEIIVQDSRIHWPDSFSFSADGDLYFTTSQIHLGKQYNDGEDKVTDPYRVWKIEF